MPSQFTTTEGKVPFWGLALYTVTFIALLYSIRQARTSVKHMTEEKEKDKQTIDELKYNLKSVMGQRYQPIS